MFFSKRRFCFFKKFFIMCTLGVGLIFCVSGCVPKEEWVYRCGNVNISSGEYIDLMSTNLIDLKERLKINNFDDLKSRKIGSKSALEWVDEETKKQAKQWVLIKNEYYTKGFENKKRSRRIFREKLDNDFDQMYADADREYGASKFGLTKENILGISLNEAIGNSVMVEAFAKGKPHHVSEDSVNEFVKQNVLKIKTVRIAKNIENRVYSDANDPKPGSKLEKKAEVKTPKELADKYMKKISEGSSIDEIYVSHNEFLGLPKSEPKFEFINVVELGELVPDAKRAEFKKMVGELEVNASPVLKEDETDYIILQRFELSEEDIKDNGQKSGEVLLQREGDKYIEEMASNNKIEVNEKMFRKYSPEKQARLVFKALPVKKNQGGLGSLGLF